jgi:hypothetical protein
MLAAGCTGVLLGGVLARSLTRSAQAEAARAAARSKLLGNTGAALCVGVSVILFALVVPAIVSNTSRYDLPRSASRSIMVVAVLHAVFAAAVLWRTRKGKAPIAPAVFGFLMTMFLAGVGTAYTANGPAMRAASIALFLTGRTIGHYEILEKLGSIRRSRRLENGWEIDNVVPGGGGRGVRSKTVEGPHAKRTPLCGTARGLRGPCNRQSQCRRSARRITTATAGTGRLVTGAEAPRAETSAGLAFAPSKPDNHI